MLTPDRGATHRSPNPRRRYGATVRSAALFLIVCIGTAACAGASTASSSKDHDRCVAAVRKAAKNQDQPGSQADASRALSASLRECTPQDWFRLQLRYTDGLDRETLTLIRDLGCDRSRVRNYRGCKGATPIPDTPCATSIIHAFGPEALEADPAGLQQLYEDNFRVCTRAEWISMMRRLNFFSEKELQSILTGWCTKFPTATACRVAD